METLSGQPNHSGWRDPVLPSEVLFASKRFPLQCCSPPYYLLLESVESEKHNPITCEYIACGYGMDSAPTEVPPCSPLTDFRRSSCSFCVTWKDLVITVPQQLSTYSTAKCSSFPPLLSICLCYSNLSSFFFCFFSFFFFSWIEQYKWGLVNWASASVVFCYVVVCLRREHVKSFSLKPAMFWSGVNNTTRWAEGLDWPQALLAYKI